MQLLRRSDSNSRPNVPDHRVSKKQANEGVKHVTDSDVKHTLKGGHYAVDKLEVRGKICRVATCNGNAKAVRAFPCVTKATAPRRWLPR